MKKKIIDTVILIIVTIILPLVFKPALLLTWPIWAVAIAGSFLILTQPANQLKKEATDIHDRSSLLLIVISVLFCFLISVVEYAYLNDKDNFLNSKLTWIGFALMAFGFGFRYYSIRTLGRFFTDKVEIQSDHELIKIGPYQYIRHPGYSGAWLGVFGVAIFLHSVYGVAICLLVYFPAYIYRIACEEKALINNFSNKYIEYKKNTWKMFPFIF